MLKLAYFSFLTALISAPIHLVAGSCHTRVALVGFSVLSVLFLTVALLRQR
jgi:hypothetical protein